MRGACLKMFVLFYLGTLHGKVRFHVELEYELGHIIIKTPLCRLLMASHSDFDLTILGFAWQHFIKRPRTNWLLWVLLI